MPGHRSRDTVATRFTASALARGGRAGGRHQCRRHSKSKGWSRRRGASLVGAQGNREGLPLPIRYRPPANIPQWEQGNRKGESCPAVALRLLFSPLDGDGVLLQAWLHDWFPEEPVGHL